MVQRRFIFLSPNTDISFTEPFQKSQIRWNWGGRQVTAIPCLTICSDVIIYSYDYCSFYADLVDKMPAMCVINICDHWNHNWSRIFYLVSDHFMFYVNLSILKWGHSINIYKVTSTHGTAFTLITYHFQKTAAYIVDISRLEVISHRLHNIQVFGFLPKACHCSDNVPSKCDIFNKPSLLLMVWISVDDCDSKRLLDVAKY